MFFKKPALVALTLPFGPFKQDIPVTRKTLTDELVVRLRCFVSFRNLLDRLFRLGEHSPSQRPHKRASSRTHLNYPCEPNQVSARGDYWEQEQEKAANKEIAEDWVHVDEK